jgi:hypothetical protein
MRITPMTVIGKNDLVIERTQRVGGAGAVIRTEKHVPGNGQAVNGRPMAVSSTPGRWKSGACRRRAMGVRG